MPGPRSVTEPSVYCSPKFKGRPCAPLRVESKSMQVRHSLHAPAPRTMILLDPDLDPAPSLHGRKLSARAFTRFLAQAKTAVRLRGEVNVLLTTDRTIRRLNRDYRGKNKATDVLSFPASEFVQNQRKNPEKGDLAISVDTARRQGAACGHALEAEIKILILHGLLHLAGYDHETDDGRMARRERQLRARLGLPQGLIERAHRPAFSPRTQKDGSRVRVKRA
jgi:probable rRNA maturation factor